MKIQGFKSKSKTEQWLRKNDKKRYKQSQKWLKLCLFVFPFSQGLATISLQLVVLRVAHEMTCSLLMSKWKEQFSKQWKHGNLFRKVKARWIPVHQFQNLDNPEDLTPILWYKTFHQGVKTSEFFKIGNRAAYF